jgi:hypothetical protein
VKGQRIWAAAGINLLLKFTGSRKDCREHMSVGRGYSWMAATCLIRGSSPLEEIRLPRKSTDWQLTFFQVDDEAEFAQPVEYGTEMCLVSLCIQAGHQDVVQVYDHKCMSAPTGSMRGWKV